MSSIYDIAKKAGVSSSTVSLILNNRGDDLRIAKKTQERVKKIAEELNYVPNVNARKLLSREVKNVPEIGLFWSPSQHYTFLNSMISKLEELKNNGVLTEMNVTIYPFENSQLHKQEKILSGSFAHAWIVPIADHEDIRFLEELDIKVPLVVLYYESEKYHSVCPDNYRTGQLAAELFAGKGIQEVGIIDSTYYSIPAEIRIRGFKEHCRQLGIESVLEGYQEKKKKHCALGEDDNYTVASRIIEELHQRKSIPQALFVQNDSGARGVIASLKRLGYRVPEEVCVVGYGANSEENMEEKRTTLLTFPMSAMAEQTWRLTGQLIAGERPDNRVIFCESDIFYADSCPK